MLAMESWELISQKVYFQVKTPRTFSIAMILPLSMSPQQISWLLRTPQLTNLQDLTLPV